MRGSTPGSVRRGTVAPPTDRSVKVGTVFHNLVMFGHAAEHAYSVFRRGDRFVAEGHVRTFDGGEEFVAQRIGHDFGGIGGRYSHVTTPMRQDLLDGLTERWNAALAARCEMHPTSPVPILDSLLREHGANAGPDGDAHRQSVAGERNNVRMLRSKPLRRRRAG